MKLTGKWILVIDDDPELRVLLRRILENVGIEVGEASGVKEALLKIKDRIPDLIILDLGMPDLDGFTFLQLRNQNKVLGSIPVMVLSGYHDQKLVDQTMGMGICYFLEKPLNANFLLQRIRSLFYSSSQFVFSVPENQVTESSAFVRGKVISKNDSQFRLECPIRFDASSPIHIEIEELGKTDCHSMVCKVENKLIEVHEGVYRQYFSIVALNAQQKETFKGWKPLLPKVKK